MATVTLCAVQVELLLTVASLMMLYVLLEVLEVLLLYVLLVELALPAPATAVVIVASGDGRLYVLVEARAATAVCMYACTR